MTTVPNSQTVQEQVVSQTGPMGLICQPLFLCICLTWKTFYSWRKGHKIQDPFSAEIWLPSGPATMVALMPFLPATLIMTPGGFACGIHRWPRLASMLFPCLPKCSPSADGDSVLDPLQWLRKKLQFEILSCVQKKTALCLQGVYSHLVAGCFPKWVTQGHFSESVQFFVQ